ncbi:MAG TPA: hypothetical protein DHV62_04480 [Elusimicrobia bacterium]|nr:hypothetical protein [Elusimicrobiota bacterium]
MTHKQNRTFQFTKTYFLIYFIGIYFLSMPSMYLALGRLCLIAIF